MSTRTIGARFASALTIVALTVGIVSPIFALPSVANADFTGFLTPTATHTPNGFDVNTVANVQTSDNSYISDNDEEDQAYTTFNIPVIPVGSQIDGIEVVVEGKAAYDDVGNSCKIEVELSWNNGASYSDTLSTPALTSTDVPHTLGGSGTTWGRTWSVGDFTNTNFVLRLSGEDTSGSSCDNSGGSRDTVSVDQVKVKIYYTAALPPDYYITGAPTVTGTVLDLAGTSGANPQKGADGTQHMAVDWDDDQDGDPTTGTGWQVAPAGGLVFTPTFSGSNPNRTFTDNWTASHNYGASGPYTVRVMVYHGNTPGQDGDALATLSFNVVIPPPTPTQGGLLVQKVLVNDNGGTAATTSFAFSIPGVNAGNPISFEVDAQNDFTLAAGAYTVTEAAAAGYAASYSAGCTAGVTAGATTTCTITNNDIAPSLTLNKVVDNNTSGGTAAESAWTLTATGPTTISGPGAAGTNDVVSGPTFKAGTYTLSESAGPAGYTTGTWSCTNGITVNGSNEITIGVGQTTVCSITNTAVAPKLTVTKVVTNDNGGTKVVGDFSLLVDLASVLSGIQNVFSIGAKSVSEVAMPGYVGTISGDCAADGAITLALGDIKSCTITNDDAAPSLTLIKSVVGGPNFGPDWTLSATGPTPISGTTPVSSDATFSAGSYTLSETPGGLVSPYYVAGSWVCTGTGSQTGDSIALDPGETATCTITNTYTPPVCDDGVDNDGDGFTDEADVGCESPTDTSEANESTLALCTDGNDNDGDEQIDLADSDCSAFIPQLTVVKSLTNDSNVGGTKAVTDFSFQINGGTAVAFDGDGSVTTPMAVGAYSVTEVTAPGYTTTYSADCTGELAAGQSKTCTITNDDIATTITVTKVLVKDSGKTGTVTDFSFSLDESEPYVFDEDGSITLTVAPGTYDVTETAAPGFTTTYAFGDSSSCQNMEITLGQALQCTITNDDIPACSDGLDNDLDGTTDQNDPGCHSDLDPENSESYTPDSQSEGNESTLALCTDGLDNDSDEAVDLEDSDCEAFLPTITVQKVILNDNGGTGTYSSFFFQVNGGEQTNFDSETGEKTVTVPAGIYTVTEVAAFGYETTYEGCSELELGAGDTATCTITNNDIAVAAPQNGQCNDGIDNEGDTLIDQQDPQCYTNGVYNPTNTEASSVPAGGGGGITGLGGGGGAVLGASTVGQVLGVSCGVYMDKYVRQGKRNNPEQVTKLQQFLNKYMGTSLPLTGFYGPLTAAAVNAFQTKHADNILAPWGISTPTGIVYRTTLRQINVLECPEIAAGIPELVEWSKANDPAKPE